MRIQRLGCLTIGLACLSQFANAPAQAHGVARLGTVEFKVECRAATQPQFNTAMALYHSFAWPQAVAAFKAIAAADPTCGMAHWGVAMSLLGNPFVWPAGLTPQNLNEVAPASGPGEEARVRPPRPPANIFML